MLLEYQFRHYFRCTSYKLCVFSSIQITTRLFVVGMCDGYEYIYDLTQTEEVITGKI